MNRTKSDVVIEFSFLALPIPSRRSAGFREAPPAPGSRSKTIVTTRAACTLRQRCYSTSSMQWQFAPEPVPLTQDSSGVLRVAGSRVTLEVLVAAFDGGATPEEIVQQYPSLDLGSVYAV